MTKMRRIIRAVMLHGKSWGYIKYIDILQKMNRL